MHRKIGTGNFESILLQNDSDSEHIVAPGTSALRRKLVQVKLVVSRKFLGVNLEHAIWARRDGDVCREADSGGHHETIVVVCVFPDQVDASWSAKDTRGTAKKFVEFFS
jgi:hypothetical protein